MHARVVGAIFFAALLGVGGCGSADTPENDIKFVRTAYGALLAGDSKAENYFDFERLTIDDDFFGGKYSQITDDDAKANLRKQFVSTVSAAFLKSGVSADDFLSEKNNWRVTSRDSSRSLVCFDGPKKNTITITVSKRDGKQRISILNSGLPSEAEEAKAKADAEKAKLLEAQEKSKLEQAKIAADLQARKAELAAQMEKDRPRRDAEAAALKERQRQAKEKSEKIAALKEQRFIFEKAFPYPGQNGKTIDQAIAEAQTMISSAQNKTAKSKMQATLKSLQQQAQALKGQGIPMANQSIADTEAKIPLIGQANINPTDPNGSMRNGRLSFISLAAKNAAKAAFQKDLENLKRYKETLENFDREIEEASK